MTGSKSAEERCERPGCGHKRYQHLKGDSRVIHKRPATSSCKVCNNGVAGWGKGCDSFISAAEKSKAEEGSSSTREGPATNNDSVAHQLLAGKLGGGKNETTACNFGNRGTATEHIEFLHAEVSRLYDELQKERLKDAELAELRAKLSMREHEVAILTDAHQDFRFMSGGEISRRRALEGKP